MVNPAILTWRTPAAKAQGLIWHGVMAPSGTVWDAPLPEPTAGLIVLGIKSDESSANLLTLNIGGVAATIVAAPGTSYGRTYWAYAVTASEVSRVTATWSKDPGPLTLCAVWSIGQGTPSPPPQWTSIGGLDSSRSVSINTQLGGHVLALAVARDSVEVAPEFTQGGLTTRYASDFPPLVAADRPSPGGTLTVTVARPVAGSGLSATIFHIGAPA